MRHTLTREVQAPLNTVLKKLQRELRRQGFIILGTVNIDKEIQDSLGVSYKKCALLTISNLQLAYKTLLRDEQASLLQFIQLIIYDKEGITSISTFQPTHLFPLIDDNYREDEAVIIEKN